ncbi:hypothetical protein HDU78_000425 [Chytriomyces hyalinus]|nr:hypothetical protein HDU78_000425 [Chytriomyces hyalinus]
MVEVEKHLYGANNLSSNLQRALCLAAVLALISSRDTVSSGFVSGWLFVALCQAWRFSGIGPVALTLGLLLCGGGGVGAGVGACWVAPQLIASRDAGHVSLSLVYSATAIALINWVALVYAPQCVWVLFPSAAFATGLLSWSLLTLWDVSSTYSSSASTSTLHLDSSEETAPADLLLRRIYLMAAMVLAIPHAFGLPLVSQSAHLLHSNHLSALRIDPTGFGVVSAELSWLVLVYAEQLGVYAGIAHALFYLLLSLVVGPGSALLVWASHRS